MALALRISSKITPSLPVSRFPGARLFRGGGSSSPALLGCPRGPRHLPSPGVPEPALRASRARGRHLAFLAIPRPLAGSQAAGQPGGAGVACTEPPPSLFSAVPVELTPLVYNCHLQDFNGPPAVHSSGRGLNCPPHGQVGPLGELGGQGWGQGWAPGVHTGSCHLVLALRPGDSLCQTVLLAYPPLHAHFVGLRGQRLRCRGPED